MTSDDHLPARFDDETSPPLLTSGTRQAVARAAPGEPDSLDEWGRYLRAVRRHKWLVLGATLLGAAAGVALAVLAVQPTYVARATVWVQVPAARYGREPGPIWSGQLPISSGWAELLRTNIVLEDVVRRQRLYLAHEQPGDSDLFATFRIKQRVHPGKYRLVVDDSGKSATLSRARNVVEHVAVGDSVGAALGFAWVPPAAALWPRRNAEFTVLGPGDAAKDLGRDLKMSADIDGNFVRLELHGPEPSAVTGTVNAIAERFVATAADLKRNNLVQLTEILSAQLERARANLRDAETALKTFRVKAVTQYADGAAPVTPNLLYPRDPAFAGLLDLKVNREGMLRDREAIGRILAASGDSTLAIDALGMIGSVQKSTELSQALRDLTARQAELRALRVHYTDAAPEVRRLAAEVAALERTTIPLQRRHLRGEPTHLRRGVGVVHAQSPQLRLPRGEVAQRLAQLRRLLHRADHSQGVDRQGGVSRRGQNPADRFPVAQHALAVHLQVEQAGECGVAGIQEVGRDRRRTVGVLGDGLHAKRLERGLGVPQVRPRPLQLCAEDLGQLDEVVALQIRGRRHEALGDRVHGPGHCRRLGPMQLEPHEVPVDVRGHLQVPAEVLGGIARSQHGELGVAPGPEGGRRRHPRESQGRADRVAHGDVLHHIARATAWRS